MKRAVVIIKGGLGNQLFSYAAARAFAARSGRELLVDHRSGFIRDGYGRSYRLDSFPITAPLAGDDLCLGDPKKLRHRLIKSLNRLLPSSYASYLAEKQNQTVDHFLQFSSRRSTVFLNGYWQNEACFSSSAEIIRKELTPPAPDDDAGAKLAEELRSTPSVFVHVRHQRYSPRLDLSYYQNSIQAAVEAVPDCRFEVFSDSPEWTRANLDFGGSPCRFHDDETFCEICDLHLMSCCRHAIVANSSFSWWGAWLGHHPDQRVWTPEQPGWPLLPAKGWITVPNQLEYD